MVLFGTKIGSYRQINQLCFAELPSLYYVLLKTTQISENDCQPVVLNDKVMELNHGESRFPNKIELLTHNKQNVKCRKVTKKTVRYHQPNPQKNIELHAHHLPFTTRN